MISSRKRRAGSITAAGAVIVAVGIAGLGAPGSAVASSHREAPMIAGEPQYDNTDVYAFLTPGASDSVTLIGNWTPFQEPAGGPNFYPWATDARHDFNIDLNDDGNKDIVYSYEFRNFATPDPEDSFTGNGTFLYNNGPVTSWDDENLLFKQTYTLSKTTYSLTNNKAVSTETLVKDARVAPSYVGKASMGSPAAYRKNLMQPVIHNIAGGADTSKGRTFAGQADDSFFLDLRVFDLAYGGDLSEVGVDTLAGYNVNTLALQIPRSDVNNVPGANNQTIGVWSTTSRKNADGTYTQISRLGQPLVNEAVIPYQLKDAFNSIDPTKDAVALPVVQNPELPKIIEAIYKIPAPAAPRNDLVEVFLRGVKGVNQNAAGTGSEQLRLNVHARFGGQKYNKNGVIAGDLNGFPNGRRLGDDVVDIALQVLEGKLLPDHPAIVDKLGDGVNRNDKGFSRAFPYVAVPHSGSAPKGAAARNSTAASHPTLLNGGDVREGGPGLPVLPIGVIVLGALVIVAGLVVSRRSSPMASSTTA